MGKRRLKVLAAVLLCLVVMGVGVLAMASTNYRLDWLVPLTGGGGGKVSSTHYVANVTVGQTAIGAVSSTNYRGSLGYWGGIGGSYYVNLPLVRR